MQSREFKLLVQLDLEDILTGFQFSGPCDREESSNSPDDSRKSGLSSHL